MDARSAALNWLQLLDDGTVIEVNRDTTDRRQTEQQLSFLAAIVQSSDDAIVSKNLDGIITSWNKGARLRLHCRGGNWSADHNRHPARPAG